MKHLIYFRASWLACTVVIGVVFLMIGLMTSNANSQTISQWSIGGGTGNVNIQGLDVVKLKQPQNTYNVWFTEFNKTAIGRLKCRSGSIGSLREWAVPATYQEPFDPFKIVKGAWYFYPKSNLIPMDYLDAIPSYIDVKDIVKAITTFGKIVDVATFTMPVAGQIGMLFPDAFGNLNSFKIWPTAATGLINPWDIQRRSPQYKENSAWVSNKDPQPTLYQFFPTINKIQNWNLPHLKVQVFYVVPGLPGKNTEIWIGGKDELTNLDCIAYMLVNAKSLVAILQVWTIPGPATRTMTAILFTNKRTQAGFKKAQVWLSSSTTPEMTILEPNSLYSRTEKDKYCVIERQYPPSYGLYWHTPDTTYISANDHGRRIWIPADTSQAGSYLFASKAAPIDTFSAPKYTINPIPFTLNPLNVDAIVNEQRVKPDTVVLPPIVDDISCNTNRYFWFPPQFPASYTGALLDIDLGGKANLSAAGGGFYYQTIWHEPIAGKIGMVSVQPPFAPLPPAIEPGGNPELESTIPSDYGMDQNYPNPFNPATVIKYSLPEDALVTLKVYNTLGQEVATLLNNELVAAGEQVEEFNPGTLPSGVYFYRIRAVGITQNEGEDGVTNEVKSGKYLVDVKKMIYLK